MTQGHAAQREAEHIFELSLDMICVAGFDGRFKAVNPAFERTLGYSPDELLARPFTEFVHPDDRQATLDAFRSVLDGDEVTKFENRYITKAGSQRWLQWSSQAVPGQNVVYAIGETSRRAGASRRSRRRCGALQRWRRAKHHRSRSSEWSPKRWRGSWRQRPSGCFASSSTGQPRSSRNRRPPGTRHLWAPNSRSRVRTSSPWCTERGTLPEWTTGRPRPVRSPPWLMYWVCVPASPLQIVVDGRLWGTMIAATSQSTPLPADTESRIGGFTELVAIAISNAQSRDTLTRLADEQAALRRVATLVAQGASAAAVFDAVAAEMERLLGADGVTLSRYESDDAAILVAHRGTGAKMAPAGTRLALTGENVASKVRRTGQAARMEDYTDSTGQIAELVRDIGIRCTVGAPIVVEGRLWGLTVSQWRREHTPPADTEERMVQFAELLGTAIANADSHDRLMASRARLLTEADDARRRVVRDLHDGAQQRLVHAIVTLKLAQRAFEEGDGMSRGSSRRRYSTPSAATRSCASSLTASFPRRSHIEGYGPGSMPSWAGSTCPSRSIYLPRGFSPRSRRARTSSWPRR